MGIFLPTSHAVSLALFVCACNDSAMPFLSCACLCNNRKWCLPSFVSPSSCFSASCLTDDNACTIQLKSVGVLSRESNNFISFRGWAYFREFTVLFLSPMTYLIQSGLEVAQNCDLSRGSLMGVTTTCLCSGGFDRFMAHFCSLSSSIATLG